MGCGRKVGRTYMVRDGIRKIVVVNDCLTPVAVVGRCRPAIRSDGYMLSSSSERQGKEMVEMTHEAANPA